MKQAEKDKCFAMIQCPQTSSPSEIAMKLRQMAISHMEIHKEQYIPFLETANSRQYKGLISKYKNSGEFAGDMGDLISTLPFTAFANKTLSISKV
jgi:hypothetical protein